MSFNIQLSLQTPVEANAVKRIIKNISPVGALYLASDDKTFIFLKKETIKDFSIFSSDEENYSLLADDANWESLVWKLNPQVLDTLASIVEKYAMAFKHFFFIAAWVGDPIKNKIKIPLEDLLQLIKGNQIANFAEYEIE